MSPRSLLHPEFMTMFLNTSDFYASHSLARGRRVLDQRLSDTALTTRHVGDVGTNHSTSPRLGVRLGAAAALLVLPIEEFPERFIFAMPTKPGVGGGEGVLSLQLVVNDRLTV